MEAKEDIPVNVNGDVCPKKQKRKKRNMLVELLRDYSKNSTLHGLRYMTEPGVSVIEKTFWVITFTISALMCFSFIRQIYHIKWLETPVIISLNDRMISVGMVSFPSVTICPEQKITSSRYNYTSELEKFMYGTYDHSDKSALKHEDIRLICQYGNDNITERICTNSSAIDNILEVSPTLTDVFFYCVWRGKTYGGCEGIFTKALTKEGVCYNFNSMAANEMFKYDSIQRDYSYMDSSIESRNWSAEKNYFDADTNAYPWRGITNEAQPDLQIALKSSANELDPFCDGMNKGYKIYLQHPSDFPQASLSYYAASLHKVTSLALKFNMIMTSTSLKRYSPNVRKCYFPGEHPLQYFQIYTQNNCQLECQSNYAFKKCGCVQFYMPHNDSESICTPKMKYCVKKALDELAELQLTAELNFEIPTCGCFPACYSIDYDAEMTNADYDLLNVAKVFGGFEQRTENREIERLPETEEYSKIDLYFKKPRFVSMRRSELYSSIELLANCGGLLGLFLGFSFLSLVEIVYFATIRLCCLLKRDFKAEKKNADNRRD